MPNWCSSVYQIQFDNVNDAQKCRDFLDRATAETERNTLGQGFGTMWLGNLLLEAGYPYRYKTVNAGSVNERKEIEIGDKDHPINFRYRGEISYYDYADDVVTIDTETAWAPMPEAIAVMLTALGHRMGEDGQFEGLTVQWYSEEPGCEYYAASDSEIAEGDCHVYFQSEGYPDDKAIEIFESDNEDSDGENFYSDFTTTKADLLKQMADYLGVPAEAPDLIQLFEQKISSDGMAYVNIDIPSEDRLAELSEADKKDVVDTVSWLADDAEPKIISGTVNRLTFSDDIDEFISKVNRHEGTDVKTVAECADIIKSRHEHIRLYYSFDAEINIIDFEFSDWLDGSDFDPENVLSCVRASV